MLNSLELELELGGELEEALKEPGEFVGPPPVCQRHNCATDSNRSQLNEGQLGERSRLAD